MRVTEPLTYAAYAYFALANQPPSEPSNVRVVGAEATQLAIAWDPADDDVGVTGYDVSLDGDHVATVDKTSYAFAGLACGTAYKLGVRARDGDGNVSGIVTIEGATTACADPPPSTPAPTAAPARKKLGYKEARELEQLPATIETLETQVAELTAAMSDPEFFRQQPEAVTAPEPAIAHERADAFRKRVDEPREVA